MKTSYASEHDPGVELHSMNTTIAAIGHTDTVLAYWQRPIVQWFAAVERMASRFQPDSELSRLNRSPAGQPVRLSPKMLELLRTAWDYSRKTKFLFQPFIGGALNGLGYDRSFEMLPVKFDSPRTPMADMNYCPVTDPNALGFDPQTLQVVKNTAEQLDLGGIGKGWAVDQACSFMQNQFSIKTGLIDAGGDLFLWSDRQPWFIGVQDPWDEQAEIVRLWLHQAGIATSNVLHRRWKQGEKSRHHILHGYTGESAESDIVQATVLAPSVAEAEVASKVLCMLGSDQGAAWINDYNPRFGYIMVKQTGEIALNRAVYQYAHKVV